MSGRIIRCLRLLPGVRKAGTLASLGKMTHTSVMKPPAIPQPLCAAIHTSAPRFGENSNVINIQDVDDFKLRVLESDVPVVLDFHASWCGPCKLLGPRLETLVGVKKDKVILAKVDIDELSDIAMDHGVEAVPTVLAMKGGKVVNRFVGLQEDDILEDFIDKLTG